VPSNSSSDDAFGPVAELVLEADDVELVAGAVGSTRGTTKQVSPPSACASTENMSFIGAT
jgi:hypothetical protein